MVSISASICIIVLLLVANFIGGVINFIYLLSFVKQSKSRFLAARNPSLVILYCIISLFTSFTTTPINLYYQTLSDNSGSNSFFGNFAAELFHELCTTMLLIVILCRSWLLFYDYKFSECSSDLIWRSVVNASEDNWFISHRKTFGNLHFIICIALICISLSLLTLSWIGGAVVLSQHNVVAFHYVSMFGLATPLFAFIIYLTQYKIKLINDIYLIHQEIKYLSYCILCRIVAFVIDLILNRYDGYLFFYSMEVATTFLSVWIQCRWVTIQLEKQQQQKQMDLYFALSTAAHSNSHNHNNSSPLRNVRSNSTTATASTTAAYQKNKFLLKIIDVFDDDDAFQEFIRHCATELSVESILFLIEIAQFKARLAQYNAFGIDELSFRFVDVMNSNFVKYIKAKRKAEEDKQLVFHPVYDDDDDDDGSGSGDNKNNTISLKTKTRPESAVASMKQEAEYKRFAETILSKKWLPLNILLSTVKDTDSNQRGGSGRKKTNSSKSGTATGTNGSSGKKQRRSREKEETKSKSKSKTKTKTGTASIGASQLTKTKSLSKTDTCKVANMTPNHAPLITPIALAVISDDASGGATSASDNDDTTQAETPHVHNKRRRNNHHKKMARQTSSTEHTDTHTHTHSSNKSDNEENNNVEDNNNNNRTVDINWMMEYGRYLYTKYVDNSANLAINISHTIRRDLWSVYSKEINEEAFQTIELIHHEHLSSISRLNGKEEQKFIQTFIFHSFDAAFHAVWQLLRSDTFYRFQKTTQYKTLCSDANKDTVQNAKMQRDLEYSKSYNESQIDIV